MLVYLILNLQLFVRSLIICKTHFVAWCLGCTLSFSLLAIVENPVQADTEQISQCDNHIGSI